MKTVMQDIAQIAGVSPGTVSNALNNKKGVGKETKDRILKIAQELGYTPSKSNEEKFIRLILFKKYGNIISDTSFFATLIDGCEKACRENNYELLITQVVSGVDTEEDIERIIKANNVDGILLLATEMVESDFKSFENIEVPHVVVDGYFETINNDYIIINNMSGAYNAIKYLASKGHKKIGYLGSRTQINNFEERHIGFKRAIRDLNLENKKKWNFELSPTFDSSYEDMKQILATTSELPTAFFAFNDIIALGAMRAMKENNIKIPEDVSIIGFDDISFSSLVDPSLTTLKVYTSDMGRVAVEHLIQKISNNKNINMKIEVGTKLVERNSVKNIYEK